MINQFYQQELSNLRELAVEFSKAHPALAPMLSGPSQDPDVERLLEGAAFLTGLLRQKLNDEFPEVVHGLMRLIFPHYLRPIPATTIMTFSPKPSLRETITVPAGTALDSVPIDQTKCRFSTCYDVKVDPLRIVDTQWFSAPGAPTSLRLRFELKGLSLSEWTPGPLRLYISGAYSGAANLYRLLFHKTRTVTIKPADGGSPMVMGPESLSPVGLGHDEGLFPYPTQSFPGYRVLQEYFILPQKFLFLDVAGFDQWRDRGTGSDFDLVFELSEKPDVLPQVKSDTFVLFATPAANLFPHEADPIYLDHRQVEYKVTPSGGHPDHYQVYSVNSVTGFAPGTVERKEYFPFELFVSQTEGAPVYYVNRRPSAIRPEPEAYLSVAYPPNSEPPQPETLSIDLMCTNANLPENLKYGDISEATDSSPELCEFRNILPPTAQVQPPLGKNLLWRFLSHLSLNLLSLADVDSLKALLKLYIFPDGRDRTAIMANEKRIEGIVGFESEMVDRLVKGMVIRGQDMRLKVSPDQFASRGDAFLFGMIMDRFLAGYASINSFTRLQVEDTLKGEVYQWPLRLGDHPLI
jgi:type VI secretion system protein ImpG